MVVWLAVSIGHISHVVSESTTRRARAKLKPLFMMLLLQHADVSLFLLEYDDISLLWRHCELVEHRIFSKKGVLCSI